MPKDLVVIISGGRTGTAFFGSILSAAIDECFSVHEPDILPSPWKLKPLTTLKRIRDFGFDHMITGRLSGRTGARNLARQYLSGRYKNNIGELAARIRASREPYFNSIDKPLIVESNYQWFALLPALRVAFPEAKIIGVIRDPRTWVASWVNYGGHHDRTDIVAMSGQKRLTPADVDDAVFARQWPNMTTFEKLCWDWKTVYGMINRFIETDENSKMFRFESLFDPGERKCKEAFIRYVAQHGGRTYGYRMDAALFGKRINQSAGDSSQWAAWRSEDAAFLDGLCAPLMKKYGYGQETAWRALTATSRDMAASTAEIRTLPEAAHARGR